MKDEHFNRIFARGFFTRRNSFRQERMGLRLGSGNHALTAKDGEVYVNSQSHLCAVEKFSRTELADKYENFIAIKAIDYLEFTDQDRDLIWPIINSRKELGFLIQSNLYRVNRRIANSSDPSLCLLRKMDGLFMLSRGPIDKTSAILAVYEDQEQLAKNLIGDLRSIENEC